MTLTEALIRKAKPREKPYKLSAGKGLSLLVNPTGSLWWRFRYRFGGKQNLLSLGAYSDESCHPPRVP
ncbi:MAG: Arm DNA-binding domain-containing protein [Leptospirales bacterium]